MEQSNSAPPETPTTQPLLDHHGFKPLKITRKNTKWEFRHALPCAEAKPLQTPLTKSENEVIDRLMVQFACDSFPYTKKSTVSSSKKREGNNDDEDRIRKFVCAGLGCKCMYSIYRRQGFLGVYISQQIPRHDHSLFPQKGVNVEIKKLLLGYRSSSKPIADVYKYLNSLPEDTKQIYANESTSTNT